MVSGAKGFWCFFLATVFGAKGAKFFWCQIVWVSIFWCQICLVSNLYGVKFFWCQMFLVQLVVGVRGVTSTFFRAAFWCNQCHLWFVCLLGCNVLGCILDAGFLNSFEDTRIIMYGRVLQLSGTAVVVTGTTVVIPLTGYWYQWCIGRMRIAW